MDLKQECEALHCSRQGSFAQGAGRYLFWRSVGANELAPTGGQARCTDARNAAAPTNRPAKVRFMWVCCLGVLSRRSSFDARPVYPAMTIMSTTTMVTQIATYCVSCG